VFTCSIIRRACAQAPHWVHGYHDIIFDAMIEMEGAELIPNTVIYNSIIHAFAKAGDSVAAEFYFIEMKKKGIRPDITTYNSLLNAYSRKQAVNVEPYGYIGRYAKPPEKPPGELEQMMLDIGPEKTNEIISSTIYARDYNLEKGKRQKVALTTNPLKIKTLRFFINALLINIQFKVILEDESEDDPEVRKAVLNEIRMEALHVRKMKREKEV